MQRKIDIKITPVDFKNPALIQQKIIAHLGVKSAALRGYQILKKSIDARGKTIWFQLSILAFLNEPAVPRHQTPFLFRHVPSSAKKIIIIGGGPAGIFAALKVIELGHKPIILERGKEVRARRRDLAMLNRNGLLNPESNYCFGEGGAGTYSDGKLYTRSGKRGNIQRILELFVHFGADENILFEAHPHIGTNKLPHIITAMRECILECGGEFLFNKKVIDFSIRNQQIISVQTDDGSDFQGDQFILATGHSAREIFELLHRKNITIEAKGFALGVRIEHPQEIINQIQYGQSVNQLSLEELGLPPAAYSLVHQVDGRGVFSFCMCPGGIIAPAATSPGELVVNGWSPSKRNNPFANSGMVVQVEKEDVVRYYSQLKKKVDSDSPFLMMEFQQMVERNAFNYGGGNFVAPAQRMVDFTNNKVSNLLPLCSYNPGVKSVKMNDVLPDFIAGRLKKGLLAFNKKMPTKNGHSGYFTNEAILVATESRTSSPIRIPREKELLHHPQIKNLFPCAEGAGYAGGIVSAAIDGEVVATACCGSI